MLRETKKQRRSTKQLATMDWQVAVHFEVNLAVPYRFLQTAFTLIAASAKLLNHASFCDMQNFYTECWK